MAFQKKKDVDPFVTIEPEESKQAEAVAKTEQAESESKVIGPKFVRKGKAKPKAAAPVEQAESMVCVALNRPNGVAFTMPDGRSVVVEGNGQQLVGKDSGILPIGGYGLTFIAEKDWEYICQNYGKMKLFTNGLIFATRRRADAQEEAEDRSDLRNGLEPVDADHMATQGGEQR